MAVKAKDNLFEKLIPVLLLASIALAFIVGVLWQKVNQLESGSSSSTVNKNETADTAKVTPAAKVNVTLDQIKSVFDKDVIKLGDASRKVLIVEIADPSCPYCHVAGGKNPEINKELSSEQRDFTLVSDGGTYLAPLPEFRKLVEQGKASFAYIYYPGHGNGEMGTKALYCANEQGKFWEAHDLIMTSAGYDLLNNDVKNDKSKSGTLTSFLAKVVDSGKMKSCLDSGKYDKTLTDDIALARTLGVQGTPDFFVNSTTYPGAYGFKEMQTAIDEALK